MSDNTNKSKRWGTSMNIPPARWSMLLTGVSVLWLVHKFGCSEDSMPTEDHAAHSRLLRSVTVAICGTLDYHYLFILVLKVKPGVKVGNLVGEWTQCSGVEIDLSFCSTWMTTMNLLRNREISRVKVTSMSQHDTLTLTPRRYSYKSKHQLRKHFCLAFCLSFASLKFNKSWRWGYYSCF